MYFDNKSITNFEKLLTSRAHINPVTYLYKFKSVKFELGKIKTLSGKKKKKLPYLDNFFESSLISREKKKNQIKVNGKTRFPRRKKHEKKYYDYSRILTVCVILLRVATGCWPFILTRPYGSKPPSVILLDPTPTGAS